MQTCSSVQLPYPGQCCILPSWAVPLSHSWQLSCFPLFHLPSVLPEVPWRSSPPLFTFFFNLSALLTLTPGMWGVLHPRGSISSTMFFAFSSWHCCFHLVFPHCFCGSGPPGASQSSWAMLAPSALHRALLAAQLSAPSLLCFCPSVLSPEQVEIIVV